MYDDIVAILYLFYCDVSGLCVLLLFYYLFYSLLLLLLLLNT